MAAFHRKTSDYDHSGDRSSSFVVEVGNSEGSSGSLCILLCGLFDDLHKFDVENSSTVPFLQRDKRPLQWRSIRLWIDLDNLQHILDLEMLLLYNETAATTTEMVTD